MSKQVRTPDGFKPVPAPQGLVDLAGTAVAGEINIAGAPVVAELNNTGDGVVNLNLPPASQYTGGYLLLILTARAPDGITLVPAGTDAISGAGPYAGSTFFLLATSYGNGWAVLDITP